MVDAADPVAADSTETAEEPEPATASVQPDAADDSRDVVSEETAPAAAAEPEPAAAESVTEPEAIAADPSPSPLRPRPSRSSPSPTADASHPGVEAEADARSPRSVGRCRRRRNRPSRPEASDCRSREPAEPEAVAVQEPTKSR